MIPSFLFEKPSIWRSCQFDNSLESDHKSSLLLGAPRNASPPPLPWPLHNFPPNNLHFHVNNLHLLFFFSQGILHVSRLSICSHAKFAHYRDTSPWANFPYCPDCSSSKATPNSILNQRRLSHDNRISPPKFLLLLPPRAYIGLIYTHLKRIKCLDSQAVVFLSLSFGGSEFYSH